jgi:hypothetical protein
MTTTPTATLELAWRPELADFAEAFRTRSRAGGTYAKLAALAVLSLVAVLVGLAAGNGLVVACAGAGVLSVLVGPFIVQPLSVRTLWRRNPALHADVRATIDPAAGITIVSHTTGQFPWSAIHSCLETSRVFIVQLTGYRGLNFVLLAKRGAAPDQLPELRRLLGSRIR